MTTCSKFLYQHDPGDGLRNEIEALNVSHGVTPVSPKRVWL